jgi:hypothetical protein
MARIDIPHARCESLRGQQFVQHAIIQQTINHPQLGIIEVPLP